jgi:hypothetical protein
MRELNEKEIAEVSGSGIAYDTMRAIGDRVGGWYNAAREAIHNDPFRRQYRAV